MSKRTKVTDELKQRICELRKQGKSIKNIMAIMSVSSSTVRKSFIHGGLLRKKQVKKINHEEVLKNSHLTAMELSKLFNVNYCTMLRYAERHKIYISPGKRGPVAKYRLKREKVVKVIEPKPEPIKRHLPQYHRINKGYGIAAELHNW